MIWYQKSPLFLTQYEELLFAVCIVYFFHTEVDAGTVRGSKFRCRSSTGLAAHSDLKVAKYVAAHSDLKVAQYVAAHSDLEVTQYVAAHSDLKFCTARGSTFRCRSSTVRVSTFRS